MSLTMFLLLSFFRAILAQETESGAGCALGWASPAPKEQPEKNQAGAGQELIPFGLADSVSHEEDV
jgi:hypothetical protein